jgi:clan AA aspartic protease (TIGR02281 family)
MNGQMLAVGVIALLTGANHAYQHLTPMTFHAIDVSEQTSDDNHQVAGDLDQDYACYVNATVDGVPFRMLVDTGSDDLAFNRNHLRKLHLNAKLLSYSQSIGTSNGNVRSAPIEVHELRIGAFVLHDVPAVIDSGWGSDEPLLGMSVIKYMHLDIDRYGCKLRW